MATILLKERTDGGKYFQIRVSRGRSKSRAQLNWDWPEGWSEKAARREAQKQAAEFERQVRAGEFFDKKERAAAEAQRAAEEAQVLTVQQFGERVFMASKGPELAENSRSSYQSNLNNWIFPTLGNMKLTEVTPAQITALLLSMQQQGKSVATRTKVYNILNGIFEMAFLQGAISANPAMRVVKPRKSKGETADAGPEMLTADELNVVLEALRQEPLIWQCFVRLLIDTGCRRGEACAICWQDIDWNSGAVAISKSLNYTKDKGVYLGSTKNGHSRTVYVGAKTLALLKQLRKEQASSCVSQWCFTQHNSPEPIHPQSPTRYLQKLSARTGLRLHPHIFRHTWASLAIQSGADVLSVSKALGHSSASVTLDIYSHGDEEAARKAATIFREAIGEK